MQTFLPYSSFQHCAEVLDFKRLGKQRVEGMQLVSVLEKKSTIKGLPYKGWVNHPAAKMWEGYTDALKEYTNTMIREWIKRGYKNTMSFFLITDTVIYPPWLGNEEFHSSHRATLLNKNHDYYKRYEWNEVPSPNVIWPLNK